MIHSPKAVLFDFDFTLGDSSPAILDCVHYATATLGLPSPSDEEILRAVGMTLPEAFRRFRGEEEDEARLEQQIAEYARLFHARADEVMVSGTRVYDFVPAMARALIEHGLRLGIVSTKNRSRVEAILANHGLNEHFSVIVGYEDVSRHKPDPEGIALALRSLSVERSEALYVGDSEIDARAAQAAGVPFVAVRTGHTSLDVLTSYHPIAVADDASAIPGIVARLQVTTGRRGRWE